MAVARHTSKAETRRFRALMAALRKGQTPRSRRRKVKAKGREQP